MRKSKLWVKREIYDELLRHCLREPAKESCGILAGRSGRIERIFPLANISDTPKLCYMIDPKEQLSVFKELREDNLELTAIYHSHVDVQAYPSKKDVELAFYPESSYVIISLSKQKPPETRSFRIIEGKIEEEELEIVSN
ncbi:MAG: M67 family metallopeptidase [Candidatus Omnitrophota bacterium]